MVKVNNIKVKLFPSGKGMINSPKAMTMSVTQRNSLQSTSELTFFCVYVYVQTWPPHTLLNPINRRNTFVSKEAFQSRKMELLDDVEHYPYLHEGASC